MKTYVAEINGEAIVAFSAEDPIDADDIVNDAEGGVQISLLKLARADGSVLWDGTSAIIARRATDIEHARWLLGCEQSTGKASDGAVIDPEMRDNPDDFCLYLIPVSDPEDDDEDDSEPHFRVVS